MKEAIELFNQAFHYSLNPEGSYSPEEIDALMEVARMRGRPDIARQIAVAYGNTTGSDLPEDRPPAS